MLYTTRMTKCSDKNIYCGCIINLFICFIPFLFIYKMSAMSLSNNNNNNASSSTTSSFESRTVKLAVLAREQGEGMGARVRRSIGRPELRTLDPFLMLDEFRVALPAGFPDHPHRGFETVSYIHPDSEGIFTHEDFKGNKGNIGPGDLQWMTAGRGIVHSEVPLDRKVCRGLQLWINLKSSDKMCEPRYQEFLAKDIATAENDGISVRIIAGEAFGVTAPTQTKTPTTFYHFKIPANKKLEQKIDSSFNSFAYIFSGEGYFGKEKTHCKSFFTIAFNRDGKDGLYVQTKDKPVEFVLISGKPLGEEVAWHGPFVMNKREELMEAFQDYQMGRNGFEGASRWRSQNGRRCGR